MQISGVRLTLTWPCKLCLLRVLLGGHHHCHKLSPFQAHWGRWYCTRFLRPVCLFIAHVGSGPSLLSYGVFLPPPLLQAFPLLVAGCVPLLLPFPAGLFIYSSMRESPPLPLVLRAPHPLCYVSFFVVIIAYYSVFLFSLGGGQSVQGAMLTWPRVVCGGTTYCLAHLVVHVFPSCLGAGVWQQHGSPLGFSV
jgi:hypothetical protein